jgi:hypothetical protein
MTTEMDSAMSYRRRVATTAGALVLGLVFAARPADAAPPAPCCEVTAIDAPHGIATAKVTATGKTFQFRAARPETFRALKLGQHVYANLKTGQVSLDGASVCCEIVATPVAAAGVLSSAPAPSAPAQPSASAGASPIRISAAVKVTSAPMLRVLSQGNRWKLVTIPGSYGGRSFDNEAIYQIQGRDGLTEAPINDNVRQALLKDAAASEGNDTVYIVHKRNSERVTRDQFGNLTLAAATGSSAPSGPSGSVVGEGGSGLDCHDPFGWGNEISESGLVTFDIGGGPVNIALNDANVHVPKTPTWAPDVNISGTLSGKFPLRANLQGKIAVRVLEQACVPIAVKLKYVQVAGTLDVQSSLALDAHIGLSKELRYEVVRQPIGGLMFAIGPIPVYLGCALYLDAVLNATAPNLVQIKYAANGEGHGSIDLTCDMNHCGGHRSFYHHWHDDGGVTFAAQGVRAVIQPGFEGGVEAYVDDPSFVNAHFGVKPYLSADVWAATAQQCPAPKGSSGVASATALTADLDGDLDLVAGIDASGIVDGVKKDFTVDHWSEHLKFFDFIGSTALEPIVQVQPPTYAGAKEQLQVRMRECYPYKDTIEYELGFGDGTGDAFGSLVPPNASPSSHTFAAAGNFVLKARALHDAHGRSFPTTSSTGSITVEPARPITQITKQGVVKP